MDPSFEIDPYFIPWPPFVVNSSGLAINAAEAVRMPDRSTIRVTGQTFAGGTVPYRPGLFWSGDGCALPVELQSFEVR